ncbi:hypothetical protein KI387_014771, partial [Taxus chinensis]
MGSCVSSESCTEETTETWSKEIDSESAEFLAREAENDEQLACLEGRMCTSGATSIASIHTQQGKKGTNQDSMIIWENFGSREDTVFLGVFDGHGPYGHAVGRRVRDALPSMLVNQWHELLSAECSNSDDNGSWVTELDKSSDVVKQNQHEEPKMYATWRESHLRAFKVMDKELKLHPTLGLLLQWDNCCDHCQTDYDFLQHLYLLRIVILSGGGIKIGTGFSGQDLVIAHVGDSRAIMGTISPNGSLSAIQLTIDMKANLPEEAERIKQCKGRVIALQDEPHVHRVWLPNEKSPGLAMTRAFGDFCLKEFGVIAIPEVAHRRLTNRDQFIVLATDGVWDVLSNREVVNIVSSASTRAAAAKMVVESAVRAWRRKFPTSKTDDCAVVCLYLDSHPFISKHGHPSAEVSTVEQLDMAKSNTVIDNSLAEHVVATERPDPDGLTNAKFLNLPRFLK